MPAITPNLWFDTQALEAAELYVSIFPNSGVTAITRYGPDALGPEGEIMTVSFELDGQEYTAINGGPMFTFTEAISLLINCADQAEIDHYWSALTADGGEESQCGWLRDRFGVSWQVAPADWAERFIGDDPAKINRVMAAMYPMKKLDLAVLDAAAAGD